MKRNREWLTTDWDHRDPRNDLTDIDCGHYLAALDALPNSLRQLLEDNTMHVQLDEFNGRYKPVKIVKKRDDECLQGRDNFFVYGKNGKRIPLTEDEWQNLLGLKVNSEDVFETDEIELETLDHAYTAPLDRWDILFDQTEYVSEAKRFIEWYNNGWIKLEKGQTPLNHIKQLQEELTYSSDWFPLYPDKRFHSKKAKQIAQLIKSQNLTKQALGKLIGSPQSPDEHQFKFVCKMRTDAKKLNPGKEKARVYQSAQNMMDQIAKSRRSLSTVSQIISKSDKSKLWNLWKEKQIITHGEIKLLDWQFKQFQIRKELQQYITDGSITVQEATQEYWKRMKLATERVELTKEEFPEWLTCQINIEIVEMEEEFAPQNWLPSDYQLEKEEEDNCYLILEEER